MGLARLILVTGKGGTGKSAVAAALALSLARRRPAMLIDLDQRMWAARMLGLDPMGLHSRDNSQFPDSARIANLDTFSLTARSELDSFIERIVPIKAVAHRMLRSRTFGYVSAALPGLEAFLMLERLRILAEHAALEDRYAVVDAPATGSALELLAVPRTLKRLAPLGTLNRLAHSVEGFIVDPTRFSVILTLTPHELALREALDAARTLRDELGVGIMAAVMNRVPRPLFGLGEREQLAAEPALAELARWRDGAARLVARARRSIAGSGIRVMELPMLFRPAMGRAELEELSRVIDYRLFGKLKASSSRKRGHRSACRKAGSR